MIENGSGRAREFSKQVAESEVNKSSQSVNNEAGFSKASYKWNEANTLENQKPVSPTQFLAVFPLLPASHYRNRPSSLPFHTQLPCQPAFFPLQAFQRPILPDLTNPRQRHDESLAL